MRFPTAQLPTIVLIELPVTLFNLSRLKKKKSLKVGGSYDRESLNVGAEEWFDESKVFYGVLVHS